VSRIRNEVVKALKDPEVARTFSTQGFVPAVDSPSSAEITRKIVDEIEANRRLAASIGLKPE